MTSLPEGVASRTQSPRKESFQLPHRDRPQTVFHTQALPPALPPPPLLALKRGWVPMDPMPTIWERPPMHPCTSMHSTAMLEGEFLRHLWGTLKVRPTQTFTGVRPHIPGQEIIESLQNTCMQLIFWAPQTQV